MTQTLSVWLHPRRTARRIREQTQDMRVLIIVLASVLEDSETGA